MVAMDRANQKRHKNTPWFPRRKETKGFSVFCYEKALVKVSVMMKISPVSLRTGAHTGLAIYGGYFYKAKD